MGKGNPPPPKPTKRTKKEDQGLQSWAKVITNKNNGIILKGNKEKRTINKCSLVYGDT